MAKLKLEITELDNELTSKSVMVILNEKPKVTCTLICKPVDNTNLKYTNSYKYFVKIDHCCKSNIKSTFDYSFGSSRSLTFSQPSNQDGNRRAVDETKSREFNITETSSKKMKLIVDNVKIYRMAEVPVWINIQEKSDIHLFDPADSYFPESSDEDSDSNSDS